MEITKYSEIKDKHFALMLKFIEGNSSAYHELFKAHLGFINSALYKSFRAKKKDFKYFRDENWQRSVYGEAISRIRDNIISGKYVPEGKFSSYAYAFYFRVACEEINTIFLRNVDALDYDPQIIGSELSYTENNLEVEIDAECFERAFFLCFKQLKPCYQLALKEHFLTKKTIKEIAEKYGITYSRLRKVKCQCKTRISELANAYLLFIEQKSIGLRFIH